MASSEALSRTAKWMSRATLVTLAAIVAAYAGLWLDPGMAQQALHEMLPGISLEGVTETQLWLGAALGLAPVSILAVALRELYLFFTLYRRGDAFPDGAGERLRRVGSWLIALAVTAFIVRCAASVLFSWHLGDGNRQLAISISSSDVILLLFGGLVRMIGRILLEAGRVAEENRQFV
ncbi:MAG: DUF2975 domain-containing protein [Rhizobiales bacterium]|nr:DUF2975 domain-containing protein [Hyphomicrobiales bacterium]